MSAVSFEPERRPGPALGWAAALALVVALHVGAGWWLLERVFVPPPPPEGAPGVLIDLEPVAVPVPPAAEPKQNAGPAPMPQVAKAPDAPPEPAAGEPPPPPEAAAPPPEPAPVEAALPPPEPAPPIPEQKPEPAPPAPTPEVVPPTAAPSDAVLAPPPPPRPAPPKPVRKVAAAKPPKPAPPKPDSREVAREAREEARRDAKEEARREARAERQAARQQARAARAAAAREGGGPDRVSAAPVASGASVASWRGEVVAHLNAYKPASPDGNDGTVRVAFSVDRGGRVISASVSGSSGDGALDAAAVSMVWRASPVPAPPPELGGRVNLAVPVRFH